MEREYRLSSGKVPDLRPAACRRTRPDKGQVFTRTPRQSGTEACRWRRSRSSAAKVARSESTAEDGVCTRVATTSALPASRLTSHPTIETPLTSFGVAGPTRRSRSVAGGVPCPMTPPANCVPAVERSSIASNPPVPSSTVETVSPELRSNVPISSVSVPPPVFQTASPSSARTCAAVAAIVPRTSSGSGPEARSTTWTPSRFA